MHAGCPTISEGGGATTYPTVLREHFLGTAPGMTPTPLWIRMQDSVDAVRHRCHSSLPSSPVLSEEEPAPVDAGCWRTRDRAVRHEGQRSPGLPAPHRSIHSGGAHAGRFGSFSAEEGGVRKVGLVSGPNFFFQLPIFADCRGTHLGALAGGAWEHFFGGVQRDFFWCVRQGWAIAPRPGAPSGRTPAPVPSAAPARAARPLRQPGGERLRPLPGLHPGPSGRVPSSE